MPNTKKKRLEPGGWKVGGAKEFLGLSSQEEAYRSQTQACGKLSNQDWDAGWLRMVNDRG